MPTLDRQTHPLFGGVGIIETDDHLTLVHLGEVLVEHRRLSMANVEVAAGLRRESSHDFALLRILQAEGEGSGSLVRPRLRRLGICRVFSMMLTRRSVLHTGEASNGSLRRFK